MQAWAATLYDNGFAGPAWPREFGGMELGFAEQVAYHDEFAKFHAARASRQRSVHRRADAAAVRQ